MEGGGGRALLEAAATRRGTPTPARTMEALPGLSQARIAFRYRREPEGVEGSAAAFEPTSPDKLWVGVGHQPWDFPGCQ